MIRISPPTGRIAKHILHRNPVVQDSQHSITSLEAHLRRWLTPQALGLCLPYFIGSPSTTASNYIPWVYACPSIISWAYACPRGTTLSTLITRVTHLPQPTARHTKHSQGMVQHNRVYCGWKYSDNTIFLFTAKPHVRCYLAGGVCRR